MEKQSDALAIESTLSFNKDLDKRRDQRDPAIRYHIPGIFLLLLTSFQP